MKTLAVISISLIGFALSFPVLIATGEHRVPPPACGEVAVILDTIRTLESGGDYTAHAAGASASGAYQYIDTTWTYWAQQAGINTDTYPTADSAPPTIQDQVAALNVQTILNEHDGAVEDIPVIWYYPAALGNPTRMDRIPRPDAGNTLTVREYQTRWLTSFATKSAAADEVTCSIVVGERWALPVPIDTLDPGTLDDPHHDYPAWDYITPSNTPIYAITDGTVVTAQRWNGNWWTAGCGTSRPPGGCNTCGNGITIETATGLRHTYCHNIRLHVNRGDTIAPGQHIADSGNTGRSGTAHLHLQLRQNGQNLCPQQLLQQIYAATTATSEAQAANEVVWNPSALDCHF